MGSHVARRTLRTRVRERSSVLQEVRDFASILREQVAFYAAAAFLAARSVADEWKGRPAHGAPTD